MEMVGMLNWETMDGDTELGRGQMESLGGTSDGEIFEGNAGWGDVGWRCWTGRHLLFYHLLQAVSPF